MQTTHAKIPVPSKRAKQGASSFDEAPSLLSLPNFQTLADFFDDSIVLSSADDRFLGSTPEVFGSVPSPIYHPSPANQQLIPHYDWFPHQDDIQSNYGWTSLDELMPNYEWNDGGGMIATPIDESIEHSNLDVSINENILNGEMRSVPVSKHLSSGRNCTTRIPGGMSQLSHASSSLLTYFFKQVIPLYSTWDSNQNELRVMMENMWQSSGALFYIAQSMAAACLTKQFPEFHALAKQHYSMACRYLQANSQSLNFKEDIALATFLIGHTASWIDPTESALDKFKAFVEMMSSGSIHTGNRVGMRFLREAVDFWRMLLSFFTDFKGVPGLDLEESIGPSQHLESTLPHVFNGISLKLVRIVAKVGNLTFNAHQNVANAIFAKEQDVNVFRKILEQARRLERELLDFTPMTDSSFLNPACGSTPEHFRLMDEAYRCAALLQLYRAFPELLLHRRQLAERRQSFCSSIPMIHSRKERQNWLTRLALHTIGLVQRIPFESLTRPIQPLVMVIAATELRHPAPQGLSTGGGSYACVDITQVRQFVGSRLSAYTNVLPVRKTQHFCDLVKHIWEALDAGDQDVSWVDVALQRQLGLIIG